MVKALKEFYAAEKRLPVSGVVPDMVGETQIYLDLQRIYVKKAEDDRAKMRAFVEPIIAARRADAIKEDEFVLFCKNV